MSKPIRGQDGHPVFPIGHPRKLCRGYWDLAARQVSLNSVQRVQRRSWKCLRQKEARAAILFLPIRPKNTNLVEDAGILLPVKFRWIPFSGFGGEFENILANQRPGWPTYFFDRPKHANIVEYVEVLLPVKFSWIPFSRFPRSQTCEKLTTTGGWTTNSRMDDAQRVITIVHMDLRLRCTKMRCDQVYGWCHHPLIANYTRSSRCSNERMGVFKYRFYVEKYERY